MRESVGCLLTLALVAYIVGGFVSILVESSDCDGAMVKGWSWNGYVCAEDR